MDEAIALPTPELSDGVIRLRPWRREDMPTVARACQDPEIARWIPAIPIPYTLDDAHAFLARQEKDRVAGRELVLAIVDATSDEALGAIGLGVERKHDRASTGYWVAPWARGRGLAVRAVELITRWALDELGLARIGLTTHVDNTVSGQVAERAGFTFEGTLRSYELWRGERWDINVYSLLADER